MRVLGLNPGPHDPAAALVVDGQLQTLLEEERLTRIKQSAGIVPTRAARACLDAAGLDLSEIDAVAVGWDLTSSHGADRQAYEDGRVRDWLLPVDEFGEAARAVPLVGVDHHLAHAASGYLTSSWDDAVIVVVDGRGEVASTSVFGACGPDIVPQHSYDIANSLGEFYSMASWWAGLDPREPGKLMGLAPYGEPRFRLPITVTDTHLFDFAPPNPTHRPEATDVDDQWFQHRQLIAFFEGLYPYGRGDKSDIMAYADFAASVQSALEETVLAVCRKWTERLGCRRVILAGGVAMNCTLNGRLAASPEIDDLHVPPVPYDAGVALGAALWVSHERHPETYSRSLLDHPYWQPPNRAAVPEAPGCHLLVPSDGGGLAGYVADRLAGGAVVALWQPRGEIGQRALGARSLLCDPRSRAAVVRMNTLKGREPWRPVAPSVLAEYWDSFFAEPALAPTRFMLAAHQVRPNAQRMIPACVHVDGSARPQAVARSVNPVFWEIIDAFRRLTGVPAVVNTSFNLAGEPIVYELDDAVDTFLRSSADTLVAGSYILEKDRGQRDLTAADRAV